MNTKHFNYGLTFLSASLTALLLALILLCTSGVQAQTRRTAPAPKPAPSLLAGLPKSDAVALVNVRQLLDEAMPKILAGSPAKLAEVNTEIEKFKTKTGLNVRSFDQVALSMLYTYPAPDITKIDTVALARGTFDTAALVAAGAATAKGNYREEKYQGLTIYIFTLDQQLKLFGLFDMKVHDLAVSALSNNVLAIGSPSTVKRAIDTNKGRAANNAELINLATREANAVIGFGANVTPGLIAGVKVTNEENAKDLSTIRQVYGTVSVTEKDVALFLAARAESAESAKNLSVTLEGLKELGTFLVGRMPAPKGTLARAALNNVKITTQGNELQIRTAVAQLLLAPLLRG